MVRGQKGDEIRMIYSFQTHPLLSISFHFEKNGKQRTGKEKRFFFWLKEKEKEGEKRRMKERSIHSCIPEPIILGNIPSWTFDFFTFSDQFNSQCHTIQDKGFRIEKIYDSILLVVNWC